MPVGDALQRGAASPHLSLGRYPCCMRSNSTDENQKVADYLTRMGLAGRLICVMAKGETSTSPTPTVPTVDLRALLVRERERLVALAYVLIGSRDEAQDVVQDVSLKLLESDLTHVVEPAAYARRAVTHECATWHRGSVALVGVRTA